MNTVSNKTLKTIRQQDLAGNSYEILSLIKTTMTQGYKLEQGADKRKAHAAILASSIAATKIVGLGGAYQTADGKRVDLSSGGELTEQVFAVTRSELGAHAFKDK